MLMVILLFMVLEGIMFLIDIPFKNRIKNSTSVETSLKARKTLKWVRIISAFVLIVVLCVIDIVIGVSFGSTDEIGRDLGMIIAYAIVKGWSILKGNIQTYSKEGYLSRHNSFVLYLRAFEADFYDKSPKSHSLESNLAKAIKKRGANLCAIGMTKELDAPYGADRVYLDDDSWQSGVSELMEKASMIFILMSDRQSCIWEISQGAGMLNKICFIIEDIEKFNSVKSDQTHNIRFPEIDTILSKLDKSPSDIVSNFKGHFIGFMMDGEDLDVFTFDIDAKPEKINRLLDETQLIRKLL